MKDSVTSGIVGGVAGAITGLVVVGAALNYSTKKKEKVTAKVADDPADFHEDAVASDDITEDAVSEEG